MLLDRPWISSTMAGTIHVIVDESGQVLLKFIHVLPNMMVMKKSYLFLFVVCICLSFGFAAPEFVTPTWHYNGGSGNQIPVTYANGVLNIGSHPYGNTLRVRWLRGSLGPYNEIVEGPTFQPYGTYDFVISGSITYPTQQYSDSYYIYY